MDPLNAPGAGSETRNRLNLTLSADLDQVLDHIATVLGTPKSALAVQALVQALPGWLEQAQAIRQAAKSFGGGSGSGGGNPKAQHKRR